MGAQGGHKTRPYQPILNAPLSFKVMPQHAATVFGIGKTMGDPSTAPDTFTLIHTKLHRPGLRGDQVSRPRLMKVKKLSGQ